MAERLMEGAEHLLHATEHQGDALGLGVLADLRWWLVHLRLEHARRHQRKGGGGPLEASACDEPTDGRADLPSISASRKRRGWATTLSVMRERWRGCGDPSSRSASRRIDEVHVVDPARTGGHAGEAGEAAVE